MLLVDLEPLDRSLETYAQLMQLWLSIPGLTEQETAIVKALKESAEKSLMDFDMCRRVALGPSFRPSLITAAYKAQQHGFPMSWADA